MTQPATATVDLGALRATYPQVRALHQGRVVAVMKANAYGHGAVRCARVIADIADTYAVRSQMNRPGFELPPKRWTNASTCMARLSWSTTPAQFESS